MALDTDAWLMQNFELFIQEEIEGSKTGLLGHKQHGSDNRESFENGTQVDMINLLLANKSNSRLDGVELDSENHIKNSIFQGFTMFDIE